MDIDTCDECTEPLAPRKKLMIKRPERLSQNPDDRFIKNRVSFEVAKYALADVIEALSNDPEHSTRIVVTKEDGNLVVMFERRPRPSGQGGCDSAPGAL